MTTKVILALGIDRATMADITQLINENATRGEKYDLRVACSYRYNRFVIKFYRGDAVIHEEAAINKLAHLVIAEMHFKFNAFLDQEDKKYQEYFEQEKAGWSERQLRSQRQ